MRIRHPLKAHGGKYYLAPWITSHMPQHFHQYVEPFCYAAHVRIALADRCDHAMLSDIDPMKTAVLRAVRDDAVTLIDELQAIDYLETSFLDAKRRLQEDRYLNPSIERVRDYIVVNRMSRGGLGKSFAWSNRLRGGQPGDANAWQTMISDIGALSVIIEHDQIHTKNFKEVLPHVLHRPDTVVYLDPTYIPDTRSAKKAYGEFEMTVEDHEMMADMVNDPATHAKVIISGYDNLSYQRWFKDWHLAQKEMPNHSGQGEHKQRRVEVLWMNYDPAMIAAINTKAA